jgi:hypothetical protein
MKGFRIFGMTGIAVAAIGMSACDGAFGLDTSANGSVAFSVDKVDSGLLGLGSSSPNEITSGGHTIVLNGATMATSEMELRGLSSGSSGSGPGTTSRFETGAQTIVLPVDGGTSREITTNIAAGTYSKFEMAVRTVRLEGTYDGSPFVVTVAVNDELEMALTPPLVVPDNASPTAVNVALDLQSWFRNAAGDLIDPRQAATDTTIAAALRSNIRSSFEAQEDHHREQEREQEHQNGDN